MPSLMLRPIAVTLALAAVWTIALAQTASNSGGSATRTGNGKAAFANDLPSRAAGTALNAGGGTIRDANPEKAATLFREGTQLRDRRGRFEAAGAAADFVDDDGMRFGGLKNLNLQRVSQVLRNSRSSDNLEWTVSGTVTEFGGRNYLLITRVVRRSPSTPAGEDGAGREPRTSRDPAAVDIGPRRNTIDRSY